MDKIKYLQHIQEHGVSSYVDIPSPNGDESFTCTPQDIIEYLKDPTLFFAKYHGVTKSEYTQCAQDNFTILCSAKTTKGKFCKKNVENGILVYPKEWSQRQGEYCHIHSGENEF